MSPVVLIVVGAIYYDVNGGVLRWLLLFSAVQCSAVSLHTEGEIRSESSFSRGEGKFSENLDSACLLEKFGKWSTNYFPVMRDDLTIKLNECFNLRASFSNVNVLLLFFFCASAALRRGRPWCRGLSIAFLIVAKEKLSSLLSFFHSFRDLFFCKQNPRRPPFFHFMIVFLLKK